MKIYKKNDKIIIELDYWQTGKYTYGKGKYKVDNLYGVIAGDELTISQAIYLDYKDDMQEGMPIVHYFGSEEDFIKLCEKLDIPIIRHSVCSECYEPIYGCSTYNAKGKEICMNCEK